MFSVVSVDEKPCKVRIAIVGVSNTRSLETDYCGAQIRELAKGHDIIEHIVVRSDKAIISNTVKYLLQSVTNPVEAIIVTGGTGPTRKDVLVGAVRPMLEKEFPEFGAILSLRLFQSIGAGAHYIGSVAGVSRSRVIYCLPDNPEICALAMQELILPEISGIVRSLKAEWD